MPPSLLLLVSVLYYTLGFFPLQINREICLSQPENWEGGILTGRDVNKYSSLGKIDIFTASILALKLSKGVDHVLRFSLIILLTGT